MNSRFIIIAILIFIKVIGVASRASADDYLPGYTCASPITYKINSSTTYKINCPYYVRDFGYSYASPEYGYDSDYFGNGLKEF